MRTHPILRLFLVWFSLSSLAAAPAQEALVNLTLEQAFKLAERGHPDLAEARSLITAAEGRAQQAGALPNPEGLARIEQAPFNSRTFNEAEYLAGLGQTVPLGSRLSKARQAEQLERDRRVQELEVRRRELRRRVHSAFATALYQDRAFTVQEKINAGVDKLVATTSARLEAGDALREELARAEMEQARARVELRRADALRQSAINALVAAIGDPALQVKALDGTLDATFEIPTIESLAESLASHPATAVADGDIRVSNARVDLARADRIPDVKVELLYRRLEAEKENAFDLGLSIPLPVFDRKQGRLREARSEAAAAEARSRSARNELAFRLGDAHAKLTSALANSQALKTEILPRANTVLESAEARYEAGDIGLGEVLPIRRDWAAVQLTYLESLRDVMQAWAALTPFMRGN